MSFLRWSGVVFEVSLIPSLRRHGNKVERSETLLTASTYYTPEGRFYDSPVILKRKKHRLHVLPMVLGVGLTAISATAVKNPEDIKLASVETTVFVRTVETKTQDVPAGVDPMTTASTTFSKRYQALPITDENVGGKLGIADPNPDENRINRKEKTAAIGAHKNTELPDLKKTVLPHVSTSLSAKPDDVKHLATLTTVPDKTSETKVAMAIIPIPKKAPARLPVPKILSSLVTNDYPDVLALGYAPVKAKADTSPFDSILADHGKQSDKNGRFIPPISRADHAWAATPLPADAFSAKEQKCLAEAVYFEARGESVRGQAAVAQVVLNRVRNPAYPNTICNVVYQNTNWINHCQFSFACDGRKHRVTEMAHWKVAQQVAKAVSAGQIWLPDVGSATHYHAIYVHPNWAHTMIKVNKIGLHVFYRTRYGGWI